MTEQEQRIRWMIKQDKEREFHPNMNDDIRFLIGEIDRLREEREKLIEGLQILATGDKKFISVDRLQEYAKTLLKSIGIDV